MAKSDTETQTPKDATGKDVPISELPPPAKLPKGLQEIVNKAEGDGTLYEEIWEGRLVPSLLQIYAYLNLHTYQIMIA
jgi:hypothetical protein